MLTKLGVALATVAGLTVAPAAGHHDLTWTSCQRDAADDIGRELDAAGAQCAEVTVPLDHAKPHGRTITVALSRIEATDPERRIGTMLINGGGPGGIGLDMPLVVRESMAAVGRRYDLVGMDPRFVGRSTPLDCGWPTGSQARSAGQDRAGFARSTRFARDLATRCAQRAGDVLPYVSTRDTARDMDLIRAALGERKLSYLGYSYGTYLGAVYTQMFPRRTDRIVLDGPTDPRTYGPRLLGPSGPASETALRDWATWTAQHHTTYALGDTTERVLATLRELVDTRDPLRVGEFTVDSSILPVLLYAGVDDDRPPARANLAEAVRTLTDAAEHGSAQPTDWLATALRHFTTGTESAYGSVQTAILCGDVAAPRNPEHYWHDIQRDRHRLPFFGAMVNNIGPCAFWPHPPREQPTRIHNAVPALIVAATGDPRTIYPNAAALGRHLTAARLLTLTNANVHGVYATYGNTCVDTTVNAYLATGRLPATDQVCQNEG